MELYDRVVVAEEDIELPRLKPKKKGRQKFESYLSIPITLHEEVIGFITMQSVERKDWFAESGMQLLRTIAANVSISIQNIRLFEEMQQAKEATEAANLELSQTLASLKATQSQLVESEKMAALGGLVAGVAHEINTPLGVGVTAASLLEDRTIAFLKTYRGGQMKRSDLEKYLETAEQSSAMILRNLERAAELIQSFKQVAVDQSTEEKRKFEVKKYLAEVLLSLRPKLKPTRHAVHINGSDELTLDSYPGTFAQVVTNLVMNSLLHAYESGEAGQLSFDFSQENNQVIFEYADDGQGIPEENLDKIFDPFFTTKRGQGGSGLGLHIIYNLVTQKLGGTISCESKVGQGTRFVIKIPTP
jgi:signal transduction histidine kinase